MALLQDTSRVRGIRQGNPLSAFIFVTVMEFISVHMHLATESGRIQPLKRSDRLHVNHLFLANDFLIFCKADKSSVKELDGLLEELHRNTGLRINEKSKTYFSKSCKNKGEVANILGISMSSSPSKYLGLLLSISYVKACYFAPLTDKCRAKVEG